MTSPSQISTMTSSSQTGLVAIGFAIFPRVAGRFEAASIWTVALWENTNGLHLGRVVVIYYSVSSFLQCLHNMLQIEWNNIVVQFRIIYH